MTIEAIAKRYREIAGDYAPEADEMMTREPYRVRLAKQAVAALPPEDKAIILLYAEEGSCEKLGALFDISHTAAHKAVCKIQERVQRYMWTQMRKDIERYGRRDD